MVAKSKKKVGVKKSNQIRNKLIKQGKLQRKNNQKKSVKKFKHAPQKPNESDHRNEDSNDEQDILDMIEDEDINFLQKSVTQKNDSLMKNINPNVRNRVNGTGKKRKHMEDVADEIEANYEDTLNTNVMKRTKYLLPIKTAHGLIERTTELDDDEDSKNVKEDMKVPVLKEASEELKVKDDSDEEYAGMKETENLWSKNEVTTADMFACREEALNKKKFHIGMLSTGLLENPEVKIKNFKVLLEMMEERNPETCITVRKLACASLLEVFKDLLPAYQIKHHDNPQIRLKKVVKQLHDFESSILKAYKTYLQKLEKMVSILRKKKGDNRIFQEPQLKLAEVALQCLCELLITHPYFNYSKNIIHLLIPYLDHNKENLRSTVCSSMRDVIKNDKRGEVSLEIVRCINHFVKKKSNAMHCEVLQVLLYLKIKDVNLDEEKEEEIKEKKLMARKHQILKMSRREKKRRKRLEALEQELLETKAEENKKAKQKCLTEITKIVFMIYFRILKRFPTSKLLSVTLEGLAKFAHCINLEFYHDLVHVLDKLIEENNLGYKEHNHCVQTVFTILSGQGEVLNIDPLRFYTHSYRNILQIHAGRNYDDLPVILKTLDLVLVKRRRKISVQRLLAFTKRISSLSLQLLHNGSLACLCLIRNILQLNKSADILLDVDATSGQGIYLPEMEEPEYCNASGSALWELLPLQRHYHPTVQKYASEIAGGMVSTETSSLTEIIQNSPHQLFTSYDPSEVKFKPSVPAPIKNISKTRRGGRFKLNPQFEQYIREVLNLHDESDLIA